jgi:hypothetical protein
VIRTEYGWWNARPFPDALARETQKKKPFAKGTLLSLIRSAGLSVEDFISGIKSK